MVTCCFSINSGRDPEPSRHKSVLAFLNVPRPFRELLSRRVLPHAALQTKFDTFAPNLLDSSSAYQPFETGMTRSLAAIVTRSGREPASIFRITLPR
jgi:hypothetical protein